MPDDRIRVREDAELPLEVGDAALERAYFGVDAGQHEAQMGGKRRVGGGEQPRHGLQRRAPLS